MLLVLTHDVDWGRKGPPDTHVLDRLHRFDLWDRARFFTLRENLYNGISLIIEYEQRQGVKSTFFFRPLYDDNTGVELYSDIVSELRRSGWEVGLHSNRGDDLEAIRREKIAIERIYSEPVVSMRVHYLKIDLRIIPKLSSIGIKFDSSYMKTKTVFTKENSGCIVFGDVIEIPITIMDTYMFTYWGVNPLETYRKLVEMLRSLYIEGVELATILWHTNSVKMVGGKEYLRFIEDIWRYEWVQPVKVRDLEKYLRIHSICKDHHEVSAELLKKAKHY